MTMAQENETKKGMQKYSLITRLVAYICAIAAVVFTVFGLLELFKITQIPFIRMSNSFMFALLFGIFGMVTRIYYKLLE
jgi:hypothetical protein